MQRQVRLFAVLFNLVNLWTCLFLDKNSWVIIHHPYLSRNVLPLDRTNLFAPPSSLIDPLWFSTKCWLFHEWVMNFFLIFLFEDEFSTRSIIHSRQNWQTFEQVKKSSNSKRLKIFSKMKGTLWVLLKKAKKSIFAKRYYWLLTPAAENTISCSVSIGFLILWAGLMSSHKIMPVFGCREAQAQDEMLLLLGQS